MLLYEPDRDYNKVLQLLRSHLLEKGLDWFSDAIFSFTFIDNVSYVEYSSEGELVSLYSYFKLPYQFDVIMCMNKYNRFSTPMFRKIVSDLRGRTKQIHIESDSSNKSLATFCERCGGYFVGDTMIFPSKEDLCGEL